MQKSKINKKIKNSNLHKVPKDLLEVFSKSPKLFELWKNLTPFARNEWICWITIVKKEETRKEHVVRLEEDILKGEKRPCCWPGCPHRRLNTSKHFTKK